MAQTTERAFETYVEVMLRERRLGGGHPGRMGRRARAVPGAGLRLPARRRSPKLWAEMAGAARGRAGEPADRRAGQGTRPQGHAARAAARLQVLRQDLPPRLLQARARAERRGAGALRARTS